MLRGRRRREGETQDLHKRGDEKHPRTPKEAAILSKRAPRVVQHRPETLKIAKIAEIDKAERLRPKSQDEKS